MQTARTKTIGPLLFLAASLAPGIAGLTMLPFIPTIQTEVLAIAMTLGAVGVVSSIAVIRRAWSRRWTGAKRWLLTVLAAGLLLLYAPAVIIALLSFGGSDEWLMSEVLEATISCGPAGTFYVSRFEGFVPNRMRYRITRRRGRLPFATEHATLSRRPASLTCANIIRAGRSYRYRRVRRWHGALSGGINERGDHNCLQNRPSFTPILGSALAPSYRGTGH